MGIRNLSNGYKAVLSYFGKQSCMQILDESGNLVLTRLKSIKTKTLPFVEKAETRQSIGFIPQRLKSNEYDRTMRQIGFLQEGQKPQRIKTAATRKKTNTISKTTIFSNNEITSENSQRIYTVRPNETSLTGIKSISLNDNIQQLQKKQVTIISANKKKETIIDKYKFIEQEKSSLTKQLEEFSTLQKQINDIQVNLKTKTDFYWGEYLKKDLLSKHIDNLKSNNQSFTEYAEGFTKTIDNYQRKVKYELSKLFEQQETLDKLKKENLTNIIDTEDTLKRITSVLNTLESKVNQFIEFKEMIPLEGQKELCSLQREITNILEKIR